MQKREHSETTAGKLSSTSAALCFIAVANCVLLTAIMLYLTPVFSSIYEYFDTEMPAATLFVIGSRAMLSIGALALATVLVAKEIVFRKHYEQLLVLNAAILLSSGVVLFVYFIVLTLPLHNVHPSVM